MLYRRHLKTCPLTARGDRGGCRCPVWCDYRVESKRIHHSLGTTDWERGERKLARILDPQAPPPAIPIQESIDIYLGDCRTRQLAPSTVQSYQKTLDHLAAFCAEQEFKDLRGMTLEGLTLFRSGRRGRDESSGLAPSTQRKEIECLRAFCAFSVLHGWMPANLGKKLKPPRERGPATLPFENSEIEKIVSACDRLGNTERARVRARAFIRLLLYSGLRISDAAKLERSKIDDTGHLFIKIMKTGAPMKIQLPKDVIEDLNNLPRDNARYFFWSGKSKLSGCIGNLRCTVSRVCKLAGVKGHPHRFRDTFAVELLQQDVPIRTVQLLLGHTSVRTTEKHYAHFVRSQQKLLDEAVRKLKFG